MKLPIYDVQDEILAVLRASGCVIIEAPTGSGKSTQVPQMLLDNGIAGDGRIVVLQPRRIAARMLARRVASERGGRIGDEVGYQVRFERALNKRTRIVYETDGIILRQMQQDPQLGNISAIVFDEFHERHLYSDIMLGFVRRLRSAARPDLKIVVMSATLDAEPLTDFFEGARAVRSEGRTYPVDIRYLKNKAALQSKPVWETAAAETARLLREFPQGDLLVFMPGAYEIRRTLEALRRHPESRGVLTLPLYGELPPAEQDRALKPAEMRRVIVATNVAETSLTIEGVTIVVDSGLERRAGFDERRGIGTLLIEKCSRASADQRAGRAGRTQPGVCLRLWSETEHARRLGHIAPELLRTDIAETVLTLKSLGVEDAAGFDWVTRPQDSALEAAEKMLINLGAVDAAGQLTEIGRQMARFPLHPRISRMLLAAERYDCVPSVCRIAAMLQERSIVLRSAPKTTLEHRAGLTEGYNTSDLLQALRLLEFASDTGVNRDWCNRYGINAGAIRTVLRLAERLERMAESLHLNCFEQNPDPQNICRCILIGFSDRTAVRTGGDRCSLTGGRRGGVASDSVVSREHRLLTACEISEIGRRQGAVEVRLGQLTAVKREWLEELFPSDFKEMRSVRFDTVSGRVIAENMICFRDLVIESRRAADVTDDEAAGVLANEILQGRVTLKRWNNSIEEWLRRLNLVAEACPELAIPAVGDAERAIILEQICHGARSKRDVKNLEVRQTLDQWLTYEQSAAVKLYAPERVRIENGRNPKVHYDDPAGPYIAMRLQELYDTNSLPKICNGKVKLKVRILSPASRPVQITDDLAGFWRNSYQQVKKDLRGRYPKHEWR